MELIIKLSKEDYEIMKHNIAVDNPLCPLGEKEMVTTIANGTPLPEHHGRLIDADSFVQEHPLAFVRDVINNAPTIIEADAKSEELHVRKHKPNREIENFIKWCKGRYGLDDETGEMYESEYGETWSIASVIAEYRAESKEESKSVDDDLER